MLERPALEVVLELLFNIPGETRALRCQVRLERRLILLDKLIKEGPLRAVAHIRRHADYPECHFHTIYNTKAFAAHGLGIVASLIMLAFGLAWLERRPANARAKCEGYGTHADDLPAMNVVMREQAQSGASTSQN